MARPKIMWLVPVGLSLLLTCGQMLGTPAPMGDEILQSFTVGLILLVLGLAASFFQPSVIHNTLLITSFFLLTHLSIWYKVARNHGYPFFGQQFLAGLVLGVLFFVILLLMSLGARLTCNLFRRIHRAT